MRPPFRGAVRRNCRTYPSAPRGTKLIVGSLDVLEIGFADRLANGGGDLGVVEIALSQQFAGLLAAEAERSRASEAAAPMSRLAIMGSFRSGRSGPMADPVF